VKKLRAPPAAHRDPPRRNEDPDALAAWTFRPIGVVRSPYRYVHDAPRQGGLGRGGRATIELRRGMREQVRPPRDRKKRGVLATRAPHRPNPIGLTAARLVSVRGRTVVVEDHDLLDGTPVLDLKPYVPYCDSRPGSRAGWVDELSPGGDDHRWA
jgi:tRNA (Thr-GGU) A37 N-methylase